MEEFSPTPAEVEETPVKRRRFLKGNFLSSWLEHRDEEDENEESDNPKKTTKTSTEKQPDENNWLPERWRDRFTNFFNRLVSLEMVPAAATVSAEESIEDTETADVAVQEQLPEQPNRRNTPDLQEEGILAVSADAQRRYYGYEFEEPVEEAEPEVEVDDIETEQPIEQYRMSPVEVNQATKASAEQRSATTEPVGDVLQRRQAERLEKKVKKLKKQTKSLKREQEDISDKQKDFVKELEDRQKAQERFEKVTVPKMERDRQELRKRLEKAPNTTSKIKREAPERTAIIAESNQLRPEVKSEYVPPSERLAAQQAEITSAQDTEKLNKLLEVPPQETTFRESVFERRHEVKDEPGLDQGVNSGSAPSQPPNPPPPIVPPPFMPLPSTGSLPPIPPSHVQPAPETPKPADSLYKQAAITGVVSGIGLTIILILIIILMRY